MSIKYNSSADSTLIPDSLVTCSSAPEVTNTHLLESYTMASGYTAYACGSHDAFPAGGDVRIIMCQASGDWSQSVEPCQGEWAP